MEREMTRVRKTGGVKLKCGVCIVSADSRDLEYIEEIAGQDTVLEILNSIRKEGDEKCLCMNTSVKTARVYGKLNRA